MVRPIQSTAIVVAALWSGTLFCVGFVLAPYIFGLAARGDANVPHTGVAADLIGPLLYGSDIAGLIVVVMLLSCAAWLRYRRQSPLGGRFFLCEVSLLIAGVCASVNYWGLTPRLNAVQQSLVERYGGFHSADRADPLYASFTALHQSATVLFMAGFLCSLICLICFTQLKAARGAARI